MIPRDFHTFDENYIPPITHFRHFKGLVLPNILKRELGKYLLILLKVMNVICRSIS